MPQRIIALLVLVVSGLIAMPQQSLGQASSKAWLSPGSVLRQGQSIASDSGQFVLWMQDDGNLVLYGPEGPMFATDTVGRGCQLEMQYDGNAVVYDRAHKPVWSSSTQGNEGAALVVQDDGNLVIYTANLATPLWASGTNVNPPSAQPTARPGWMLPGDVLHANQSLASESGEFVLWMQNDGNLVLYGPEGPVFATGTNGRGVQVEMQYDGNVVVYDANHQPVWATETQGHDGAVAVVQNDGNFVVYAANGTTALWASRDARNTGSGGTSNPGNDTEAPIVGNLNLLTATGTSATVNWTPATDNVGVAGYELFKDGTPVMIMATADALPLEFIFVGLQPSTTYLLGLEAFDMAGNRSTRAEVLVTTDNTRPSGCDGALPEPTDIRLGETLLVLPAEDGGPNVVYNDQNPARCYPSNFVLYGGTHVFPVARAGDMILVDGPGIGDGWIDDDRVTAIPSISFPITESEARQTLANVKRILDVAPNEPMSGSVDGVHIVAMKASRTTLLPVLRRAGEGYLDAAIRVADGPRDTFVMNTNFFDCDLDEDGVAETGCSGALLAVAALPGPRPPEEWPPQGLVIEGGQVAAGSPSQQRNFFGVSESGGVRTWLVGEGDPPSGMSTAFGGAISLNSIQNNEPGDGMSVFGFHASDDIVFLIVQANGADAELDYDDIRAAFGWFGIDFGLVWDGGTSSSIVHNSAVLASPGLGQAKNHTMPAGAAFVLPLSPCAPSSTNCDPTQ